MARKITCIEILSVMTFFFLCLVITMYSLLENLGLSLLGALIVSRIVLPSLAKYLRVEEAPFQILLWAVVSGVCLQVSIEHKESPKAPTGKTSPISISSSVFLDASGNPTTASGEEALLQEQEAPVTQAPPTKNSFFVEQPHTGWYGFR
jgi:hypothetical protein